MILGAVGTIAGVGTAVIRRGEKQDAIDERAEKTFAKLFDSERSKREEERGDCTQRIETLRRRIDDTEEKINDCERERADDRANLRVALERIERLEHKSNPPAWSPAE